MPFSIRSYSEMDIIMLKLTKKKEIRFLLVGILNTVFGYGIYALFCYLEYTPSLAITIATILGTVHSFLWNKFYTFKSKEKSILEIIKFIAVYFISYLINLAIVLYFSRYHNMDKYIIGLASIFVSTIVSYVGHNKFSFKS